MPLRTISFEWPIAFLMVLMSELLGLKTDISIKDMEIEGILSKID